MTPNPHDALFRATFGQPRHAAAELRAVLPAELLAQLDLESLAPLDGSFVDDELKASCADLLFEARLRPLPGAPRAPPPDRAFVCFLIEHQSTPDRRMPLRLLGYMTRIWERFAANAVEAGDLALPPIVPILIHQGPKPWPWPTSFRGALASHAVPISDALGRRLLDFDFVVDDLALVRDDALLAREMDAIPRLVLVALRNARLFPRLDEPLVAAISVVGAKRRSRADDLRSPALVPALVQLFRYVLEVGDGPPDEVRARLAAALAPEIRSEVMSTADMLRAQGRNEGLVEGRTEGQLEARRESLREQLEIRFGALDAALRSRVESASMEQLVTWLRSFAVARTLDEVFAS